MLVVCFFFVSFPTFVLLPSLSSASAASSSADAGGLLSYTSDNFALIVEEAEPGTLVANLSRIPAYGGRTASSVRLVESSDYFLVQQQSMALVQRQKVDREALCSLSSRVAGASISVGPGGECSFALRLWVNFPDNTYERSVPFNVKIQDVNDNEPRWPSSPSGNTDPYVVEVPENAPSFYKVALPTALSASDPDQGLNGAIIYRLAPTTITSSSSADSNSQAQSIVPQTRRVEQVPTAFALDTSDPVALKLFVREPLDHERNPSYGLNLTACDQGNPARCSWRLLTVRLYSLLHALFP